MKKRWIIVLMLLCVMSCGTIANAAYYFLFPFPAGSVNSLRKTSYYLTTGSVTDPYIHTNTSTIKTVYFIAPFDAQTTMATDYWYITTTVTRHFTWNTGYGGANQHYRLEGYPSLDNYEWDAYDGKGYWDLN